MEAGKHKAEGNLRSTISNYD